MYICLHIHHARVLYKQDLELVTMLADLELGNDAYCIFPEEDILALRILDLTSLQRVYAHLTRQTLEELPKEASTRENCTALIFDALSRLKPTDVHPLELEAQWAYGNHKAPDEGYRWIHVKGARLPQQQRENEIFESPMTFEPPRDISEAISRWKKRPQSRVEIELAEELRKSGFMHQQIGRAKRSVRTNNGPSKKETIWKKADELWLKHGSPSDRKSLLGIRKIISNILVEDYGMNKNNVGCELSLWQKTKISL